MTKPTNAEIQERHNDFTTEHVWTFGIVPLLKFIDRIHHDRGILLKRLEAAEKDCAELSADLSAERRVSYTFKESLDKAEQTIKDVQAHLNKCTGDAIDELQAIINRNKS